MSEADRLRLAGRVPSDYLGYGYAPLLAEDMQAIAGVANDVAAASLLGSANAAQTAEDRVQTGLDRVAAAGSASAAAGIVGLGGDITVGRRLHDPALWTFARSTPAWGFDALGNFVETGIDTIRWEFDPITGVPLGAAFAGARTNNVRNPRAEGQVAGAPGTQPTNWVAPTSLGSGLSREMLSPVAINGVNYTRIRYSGTASASNFLNIQFDSASAAATANQLWTISVYLGMVINSGTMPTSVSIYTRQLDAGSALTDADNGSPLLSLSATPALFSRPTTAVTNTTQVLPYLRMSINSGVSYDFSLLLALPQLERGPFASARILPAVGTPAVSTRAQGTTDVPINLLGTAFNRRQGTAIISWNSQPGAFTGGNDVNDFMGLLSFGDQSANEVMGLVVNNTHTQALFRRTIGGVAQTTASVAMTPPAAGTTLRSAFAWDIDAGLMQAATQGVAGTQLTGQAALPLISHAMIGRFSTTRALYGRINGLSLRPVASFGSALAALT